MLMDRNQSCLMLIDVQDKLTPLVNEAEQMMTRARWLLSLGSDLNVPRVVCEQYPKGLGATVASLQGFGQAFPKVHFSSFEDAAIRSHVAALHKPQIVLIGIETHVCVLQTALGFLQGGYEVFVAVDAVSARSSFDHRYGLKRMKAAGVVLVTAEMVFFEWLRQAGTAEFKLLSAKYFAS